MNTRISLIVLAIMLLVYSLANAQYVGSVWGYGFEGGVAQGDNAPNEEEWVPMGRGHLQLAMSNQILARFGVGYTQLKAADIYNTKSVSADVRLLFRPIQMKLLSPFIYAGFGAAKDTKDGQADIVPIIPAGLGIQTKLSSRVLLELSGGYNLSLSDMLDGRKRGDNQLNRLTNQKQDGYFNIMFGIVLTRPYKLQEPKQVVIIVEKKPVVDPLTEDTDGDGISNGDEISKYRTDVNKKDTDGDGISDGDEILIFRTNPLVADTDKDGLKDGIEVNQYKTDPNKADTDNDGLNDFAEVSIYFTDPLNIDTDGGGLNDGTEIKAGKNPLVPTDDMINLAEPKKTEPIVVPAPNPDTSLKDTDGDGLYDVDEQQKYQTNVNLKDTDGDGLSDGDEVLIYHTDPLLPDTDKDGLTDGLEINQYKTDPNKADTDGDSLDDYAELMTHRTDPLKIDTDGGGMNDGAEIVAGKNPLNPKDDLLDMTKGKKVVLDGIMFNTGRATIKQVSESILNRVYTSLVANPDVNVIISGHTDSVGGEDGNRALSLKRAQSVKDWLVEKGISSSRIDVIGKGEAEPIASNETSEGRAKNRRIEFEVQN
ncbi:MAG: OmpA family protein [Candidatus Cloacimonetes bacterium]|nr:OmpA family protein [Candidatus Cloacimonadota bacterium]